MKLLEITLVSVGIFVQTMQAAHADFVLNDGGTTNLEAVARDTHVSMANEINALSPAALPFNANHTATMGNSSSYVEYIFGQDGFAITSMGARDGLINSRANAQGDIFFSVSVDTPYRLAGDVTTVDPSGKGVELNVRLTDLDTLDVLFYSHQASFGVVDEAFVLGGMEGNNGNQLVGSLDGTLLGGHRYQLFYANSIYASNSGEPATATGHFSLTTVPEPSTVVVLIVWSLLGTLAATISYWRKRKAA